MQPLAAQNGALPPSAGDQVTAGFWPSQGQQPFELSSASPCAAAAADELVSSRPNPPHVLPSGCLWLLCMARLGLALPPWCEFGVWSWFMLQLQRGGRAILHHQSLCPSSLTASALGLTAQGDTGAATSHLRASRYVKLPAAECVQIPLTLPYRSTVSLMPPPLCCPFQAAPTVCACAHHHCQGCSWSLRHDEK